MAKGVKTGGGSRKGVPNKLTRTVKEAFEHVFKDLQKKPGEPYALGEWAKREPDKFYPLAAKLIPQDVKAQVSGTLKMPGLEVVAAALGVKPEK